MVRKFTATDLDAVMLIWKETNRTAHSFIAPAYWESHFQEVKEQLPQAEVYVFEEGGEVQGFIGLAENLIAGIFVREKAQGRGIGRQLLNQAKAVRNELFLQVYSKNSAAAEFYRKQGFYTTKSQIDCSMGETELIMEWRK